MEVRKILGFTWNTWRLKEEYVQMDGEHGEKDDQETNRKQNNNDNKISLIIHSSRSLNFRFFNNNILKNKNKKK